MQQPTTPVAGPSTRNPFVSALFTKWWLASVVAGTGVGIQAVTVPLFIRDRVDPNARAMAIAGALIAQTLPGALLALVGGSLADRIERRRILVRTYTIAAVVSSMYVLLCGFDVRVIWPVFPLAAVVGAAGAFTNPARQSMLPQLVSRSQLQNAVIFGTMGFMATMQFLGPSMGGLVTDLHGLTTAFAMEMVLLTLAAVIFSRISTDQPTPTGRTVLGDLVDGIRYVFTEPALLTLLFLGTVPGVFMMGPFGVTIALVVPDVLHASDRWVGLLYGCFGAGIVLGSILLTLWRLPHRGLAIGMSVFVAGVILVFYGYSTTLSLSVALLLLWGLCPAVFINYVVALLQERAAPQMMGRVMSMYSLGFLASAPLGYAQAGIITTAYGPRATLVSSGIIAAAIGLACVVLLKPLRDLD